MGVFLKFFFGECGGGGPICSTNGGGRGTNARNHTGGGGDYPTEVGVFVYALLLYLVVDVPVLMICTLGE